MLCLVLLTLVLKSGIITAIASEFCESTYISTSRCFEDYGTQLESRIARSLVDCSHDCNTLAECRSIFYDPATKLCRINAATLSTTAGSCGNPIKYLEFTENSCQTASSMRSVCSSSVECDDVVDAECRDGFCKCLSGLGYHQATRQCVSDCGQHGYGNTYQETVGAILIGFFNHDFRPMEVEDCKQLCIDETTFVCRTAESYVTTDGVRGCQLSWETFYTNPEAYYLSEDSFTYVRDCA